MKKGLNGWVGKMEEIERASTQTNTPSPIPYPNLRYFLEA
jgi:hypothetical protein